tara:strand:+ start:5095 stop:5505 length:411 start_codon:yes stop_codon:yes gene_type:complete
MKTGSILINNQVPKGAAIMAAKPNGTTKPLSALFIAIGRSCNIEGSPLRVAIATAERGPKMILAVITMMSDAPKPTKPRTIPANRMPSPISSKFHKLKTSTIASIVLDILEAFGRHLKKGKKNSYAYFEELFPVSL